MSRKRFEAEEIANKLHRADVERPRRHGGGGVRAARDHGRNVPPVAERARRHVGGPVQAPEIPRAGERKA